MRALVLGSLFLGIGLGVSNWSWASPNEVTCLRGKVVELGSVLKAKGVKFDNEPVAKQVVLEERDGTVVPVLSDEASRALFLDERLRERPAELQVRRIARLPYVQVVSFQVEHEGRMRTPEYYCEICSISVRFPQICPCCQGPMELRMKSETR